MASPSPLSCTSTSMPNPAAIAARTAAAVFSIRPLVGSCSPRCAIGRAVSQSSGGVTNTARSGDLERAFYLDCGIGRQRRHADRRARVLALVAEHRDHQIGGAVHHLWPVAEARRRIDKAAEPYHANDLVEIADRNLDLSQQIYGAGACRFLPVLDGNRAATLPFGDKLAVGAKAELAGNREQVACTHERYVIRDRCRRIGQADTKLSQLVFRRSGHG